MNDLEIEVLLSTYNGESFLQEQIDSILTQSGVAVRILARDDGSIDSTLEILRWYAEAYSDRFKLLSQPENTLGVIKSYEYLLKKSTAPLVAFSDQDDVWSRTKLAESFKLLREIDKSGTIPALVYTDLCVVSEDKTPLHESFFSYMGIDPRRGMSAKSLSIQNCIVGCTTLFNRALIDIAVPFPDTCIMHDWWLGLCAAYFGRTGYLTRATVDYRQHPGNVIGARSLFNRLSSAWFRRTDTFRSIDQAISLLEVLRPSISEDDERYLKSLSQATSNWSKKYQLLKHGVTKDGFLRNLYFFLLAKSS